MEGGGRPPVDRCCSGNAGSSFTSQSSGSVAVTAPSKTAHRYGLLFLPRPPPTHTQPQVSTLIPISLMGKVEAQRDQETRSRPHSSLAGLGPKPRSSRLHTVLTALSVVSREAQRSPRSLAEMHSLRPHLRPPPASAPLTRPPGDHGHIKEAEESSKPAAFLSGPFRHD